MSLSGSLAGVGLPVIDSRLDITSALMRRLGCRTPQLHVIHKWMYHTPYMELRLGDYIGHT